MSAETDVITLRCPECRAPLDGSAGLRCGTHGLYGLDAAGLEHLPDHPLLGQILDEKYALVGVLGRGGTGSVYRALQEPLGRPVGVKLLHSAFLSAREGRERFEREARALAGLTSVHTVRLLDYGITRQGPAALRNIAYLVMELLDGEDLEARLTRGPLAPVDVLAVLDALADSLDEAHAAGIVHRDLKPANVVVTRRRDGREIPKLIDFGIARVDGGSLTEQGRVSGTPFYMAPEQARGDDGQDAAADVYGAGALCFNLLTGHVPFSGPSAAAVMMAHCRDEVPPLDPTGADPVLARLDPVIRAAMSKDPAARPASLGALRDAYARALGTGGTEAVTVATPGAIAPARPALDPPAPRPAAVPWRWVLIGAGGVLALVALIAVATRPTPLGSTDRAAFGVAQPEPTARVVSAAPAVVDAPAVTPTEPTPPPAPATAAPPTSPPPAPPTRARPAPPSRAPSGGARTLTLREDGGAMVDVPAGRWRITATVDEDDDPVTFVFPPKTCPARGKPGVRRYAATCTFDRPASVTVHNPTNFFGDTTRVRVEWAPAK
jgi:hypothetical protein